VVNLCINLRIFAFIGVQAGAVCCDTVQHFNFLLMFAELPATVIHIDYRTVDSATKAFSRDRLLGDGTLGPVYRGNLSNTAVAIKVFQKVCICQS
jgi:hypothetical protein